MDQKIDSVVRLEISHVQVHHPEFQDEMMPKFTIPGHQSLISDLKLDDKVKDISERAIAMSMLGSANKSGAVKVMGVHPDEEANVTDIHEVITDGAYFEGVSRNPILVSQKIAEEYKVKIRSKMVLTVNDIEGEIISGAFRVVGIYDTKNPLFDKMNVFVRLEDLQNLLGLEEAFMK